MIRRPHDQARVYAVCGQFCSDHIPCRVFAQRAEDRCLHAQFGGSDRPVDGFAARVQGTAVRPVTCHRDGLRVKTLQDRVYDRCSDEYYVIFAHWSVLCWLFPSPYASTSSQ